MDDIITKENKKNVQKDRSQLKRKIKFWMKNSNFFNDFN